MESAIQPKEAVAITRNRIVAMGNDKDVLALKQSATRVVELGPVPTSRLHRRSLPHRVSRDLPWGHQLQDARHGVCREDRESEIELRSNLLARGFGCTATINPSWQSGDTPIAVISTP
jgi:hypothetical protein